MPASVTVTTGPTVQVWRTMLELHADVIGALDEQFRARHGLTVAEFDVLINLGNREQVRHGELASRVILTRTALTRMIDRLARRGWVRRLPVVGDQRGVLVELTAEGRRVRASSARTNRRIVDTVFAALTPTELTELGELTARLRDTAYERGLTT